MSLLPVLREEKEEAHDYIITGAHGSFITVTDGRYKLILAPNAENWPLYSYTLMPTHMRSMFAPGEFEGMELSEPFEFTKGVKLLKIPDRFYLAGNIPLCMREPMGVPKGVLPHQKWNPKWTTKLFDLANDPTEQTPIEDAEVTARLRLAMTKLMIENDAPIEQYVRMQLEAEYETLTGKKVEL